MIQITDSMDDFATRVSKHFFNLEGNMHLLGKGSSRLIRNPRYRSDDGHYAFRYMDEKGRRYRTTNPVDVLDNGVLEMNRTFFSSPEFRHENFIYYNVIWGFCMFFSQGSYDEADEAAVKHYLKKRKDFSVLMRGLGYFFSMNDNYTNQIRLANILKIKEIHDAYEFSKR